MSTVQTPAQSLVKNVLNAAEITTLPHAPKTEYVASIVAAKNILLFLKIAPSINENYIKNAKKIKENKLIKINHTLKLLRIKQQCHRLHAPCPSQASSGTGNRLGRTLGLQHSIGLQHLAICLKT
jgi:hypothetical protein